MMRGIRRFLCFRLGAPLVLCCSLGLPQGTAPQNSAGAGVLTFAGYNFAGKTVPKWTGGALVALEGEQGAQPLIHVFGISGQETMTVRFTLPEANVVDIRDVARGPDGSLVLCGWTQDSQGRAGEYLALVSPDGTSVKIVRTDPYAPFGVAVAPDGTIWARGIELDPSAKYHWIRAQTSVGVIRHLSASGILLGAFIPQSGFSPKEIESGRTLLAPSPDRLGWYQEMGHSYFEVMYNGTVAQYPGIALQPHEAVVSLAITDNGQVYANKWQMNSSGHEIYRLDRNTRAWSLVTVPAGGGPPLLPVFLGSSGNALLMTVNAATNTYCFFAPM
jgi:hypothetical protein